MGGYGGYGYGGYGGGVSNSCSVIVFLFLLTILVLTFIHHYSFTSSVRWIRIRWWRK